MYSKVYTAVVLAAFLAMVSVTTAQTVKCPAPLKVCYVPGSGYVTPDTRRAINRPLAIDLKGFHLEVLSTKTIHTALSQEEPKQEDIKQAPHWRWL
ncbi:MAG: hypothetical protein J3R72DRAFT_497820 [Linnemannia gamsii]|nr:MAG: hypothetical protein J3R72DRAFT_497820 [Linnemannia gamsii]